MSSKIVKKIVNQVSSSAVIYKGLVRRKTIAGAGLHASDGININRIAALIRYKCHKNFALMEYGIKLDNFQSVKDRILALHCSPEAEAASIASEIICRYSLGIATETISDATFKASKVLNWWCHDKRVWGSIADSDFTPANFTLKLEGTFEKDYDRLSRDAYVMETFGVPRQELSYLALYAATIFRIDVVDALAISRQVIAIEKIIEAAFEASQALNLLRSRAEKPAEAAEPIDGENHREKTMVGEDEPLKECQTELSDNDDSSSDGRYNYLLESLKPGFMEGRDETCIFSDSERACKRYKDFMNRLFRSSININWGRMASFMEFKARKEYAMETYGVRVGDFHSLKENALRLFVITEEKAAIMASKTMELDSESIAFEKIGDAAFKASKILNWDGGNQNKEVWGGNIGDASGFKSPKSMKNYCKDMDVEARKAYTMQAFGVSSVEIDYIKGFAMEAFLKYNNEELKEAEAIIIACESVAVDHVVDAVSKNLNLAPQLDPLEAEMARTMPLLIRPMSGANSIFSPENLLVQFEVYSV
jgi:hypothetical protein